ncbi:tripartite tricarboxylate transporter TctB family protein [Natronohydrobacter thiooxidans]|uniref:tripartite tricarboxylate transporter TctB family protein n=1 Tax=Natronohydrobacter thiooxidans TaxID=87172 RepID=UPI0008FF23E8|nr:tripartite tricarboxylate transporter TctB family protein [Natronohydrobacter thiooxidans]
MKKPSANTISAVLAITIGAFVVFYGFSTYRLGAIQRMGPGMVPVIFGAILAILGAILLTTEQFNRVRTELPVVAWRPLIWVLAAVLAFALALPIFGVVPATVLLILISSRADGALSILQALGLAAVMACLIWLVFGLALNLPIPFLTWRL